MPDAVGAPAEAGFRSVTVAENASAHGSLGNEVAQYLAP